MNKTNFKIKKVTNYDPGYPSIKKTKEKLETKKNRLAENCGNYHNSSRSIHCIMRK